MPPLSLSLFFSPPLSSLTLLFTSAVELLSSDPFILCTSLALYHSFSFLNNLPSIQKGTHSYDIPIVPARFLLNALPILKFNRIEFPIPIQINSSFPSSPLPTVVIFSFMSFSCQLTPL